jgi:hypothetical protein
MSYTGERSTCQFWFFLIEMIPCFRHESTELDTGTDLKIGKKCHGKKVLEV